MSRRRFVIYVETQTIEGGPVEVEKVKLCTKDRRYAEEPRILNIEEEVWEPEAAQ